MIRHSIFIAIVLCICQVLTACRDEVGNAPLIYGEWEVVRVDPTKLTNDDFACFLLAGAQSRLDTVSFLWQIEKDTIRYGSRAIENKIVASGWDYDPVKSEVLLTHGLGHRLHHVQFSEGKLVYYELVHPYGWVKFYLEKHIK